MEIKARMQTQEQTRDLIAKGIEGVKDELVKAERRVGVLEEGSQRLWGKQVRSRVRRGKGIFGCSCP